MNMNLDDRWLSHKVTGAFLEERAAWLKEDRKLHSSSLRFFELAGTLVSFSRFSYPFASVAFFHGILGLEPALKLHYHDEKACLSDLLRRAVVKKLVNDALFGLRPPFTKELSKMVDRLVHRLADQKPRTHSELLPRLIPELRNEYFNGDYLLAPDFLHLTFQLREIADALTTLKSIEDSGKPKEVLRGISWVKL